VKLIWLALAWIVYGAVHSALASFTLKERVAKRWPGFMPGYRLAYNAFATVAALPILWLIHAAEGDWLWRWTGTWAWIANGLALATLVGFVVSARHYDMAEFLGLRQLREGATTADRRAGFAISPFHRYVRHPWYAFGLVLVWTRDMNGAWLVSALAITAYFAIGSLLEERKLLSLHGDAYRRYRERVPGLVPLPWKFLRADEAQALVQGARD
jgi:protein-S-isoprenylcysteine O-methyltransferase Ste14